MLNITVTYQSDYIPYNAASVKAPTNDVQEALDYAYRWTQNLSGSWSNKIGDTFTVWFEDKTFKKFKCAPIGFEEVV